MALRNYEVTYILDPTLGDDAVEGLKEKFSQNVSSAGGEIQDIKSWGKRRLAYELNGRLEGIYVTMRFDSDTGTAAELRRIMGLSDEVMRSMFVRTN
ncbi:MAG: 30S ribosomal protein S6 [Vulcanimicrobiota bacterium]|nr:30S ribosomal protein S6 [Candidatus Eremiobacteraeota bacterium]